MHTVTIDFSNVDWKLLRSQKLILLAHMDGVQVTGVATTDSPIVRALQGIIYLLDDIQDQAAEIIGEETVFGKPEIEKA